MTLAQTVYRHFLNEVVAAHVFGPAERTLGTGVFLSEGQAKAIADGRAVDPRPAFLVTRSGKGGWHADPKKAENYGRFANVTLLDHLVSVVRGALQFAVLDLGTDRASEARLRVVAAIAFLHDADKMEGLARTNEVGETQMEALMRRYGIAAFLKDAVSPSQMLALVDAVEVSRDGRMRPDVVPPPREARHDCTYVRLADRLDGLFLKQRPDPGKPGEKIGADGVVDELDHYDQFDTPVLKKGWRRIEIRDPHTPFLLDAFQAGLSYAAWERQGQPPLIEVHHDGRLIVIIPEAGSEAVIDSALSTVTRQLGAAIRVGTTTRGKVDLLDAPGTIAELAASIARLLPREREIILRAGKTVIGDHREAIDAFLRPGGLLPRLPDLASSGQLVPLWTGTEDMDEGRRAVHADAALINAVLSCDDPSPKLGIPPAEVREGELRAVLGAHGFLAETMPDWLARAPDDTRRALLAGLAAGAADRDEAVRAALLDEFGLVALWLQGRDGRRGLNDKIDPAGARLASAVAGHYRALLSQKFVVADESFDGRCHFTNAPVPRTARIDGKTGLYGVNVSAFSGREGRPESARSAYAETLVSPVAEAEHRLRQIEFERGGRSSAGRKTPVRITSPTTAGLFAALVYPASNDPLEFALSDVLRERTDTGRLVFDPGTAQETRLRIARYEEMPTRLVTAGTEPGQIAFVAMVLKAARRTGRPIHVFRGLPHPRGEFVAFDTLPPAILLMLGGDGLRLEQIPFALTLLDGVERIANATGFGPELAMRVGDPQTRFSASCDALARADTRLARGETNWELSQIQQFCVQLLGDIGIMKSNTDRALVTFGEAMARVQRVPLRSDGGTVAELGLRTALDTVETLERMGETHLDSLLAGVAGEIMTVLQRRTLFVRKEVRGKLSFDEALKQAAAVFVENVWHGAFKGTAPSSRNRRVAFATYGYAFESAARSLSKSAGHGPDAIEEPEAA